MANCSPYEYYDGVLGVQIRFLIRGRNADEQTLSLINYDALVKRMNKKDIQHLRHNAPNIPALVRYDMELPNGRRLNDADLDKYVTNASVLAAMDRIYRLCKITRDEVCGREDG